MGECQDTGFGEQQESRMHRAGYSALEVRILARWELEEEQFLEQKTIRKKLGLK